MTTMDRERLAAFADGELPPEEAAAVVLHLARHPDDQAWVDELFAANAALAQAFSDPLHEPVPEAIRAAIFGPAETATVVTFRPRPRLPLALGGLALAATVAAAALLLPALLRDPAATGVALGPVAAADPVAQLLQTGISGAPAALEDGREVMVLASFAMPDGRFCREFELVDAGSGRVDYAIGCRSGAGWQVEVAIAEAAGSGGAGGFAPAGGAEADMLTRFLERGGAPAPLDAAAEAEAIRNGWAAR
jgi:negative regulator of sigma E activity